MHILFQSEFEKKLEKLPRKIKEQWKITFRLFYKNPCAPILRNHALKGKYRGARSINVTGDIRAIYDIVDENIIYFRTIGSHSELYK